MKHLNAANARLKGSKCRLRIEIKDQGRGTLNLRGQLPPKDGQGAWSRQRIYLGLPANPSGVAQAEKMAKKISADLDVGQFFWDGYLTPKSEGQDLVEAIELYHQDYLAKGGKDCTWQSEYHRLLSKLKGLSESDLIEVVKGTKPDTRNRVRACHAVSSFARFLKVSVNLEGLRGNYNPYTSIQPREIPTDEDIARYRDSIPNPSWQWVYGMIAAYGLRNHEVFRLDLTHFPLVKVGKGTKTGDRECYPCFENWIQEWGLGDFNIPKRNPQSSNQTLGHAVNDQFSRYGIPFPPYNLRHAWAIRTLDMGWPVDYSARMMGHSVEVHTKTYQRWISSRKNQEIYQRLPKIQPKPLN